MSTTWERVLTFVLYAVFGALAGAIGTFAHRARIDVFGHAVWFGIVLALVCMLALTVGVRIYLSERWASYGFAIGLVAAVGYASTGGPGQSVLMPASQPISYVWLFGAILIAIVVTFWPRLPPPGDRLEPDDVLTPSLPASAADAAPGVRGSAGGAAEYPGIVPSPPSTTPKESQS